MEFLLTLYLERILQSQSAIWLSDSGIWLAFLKLNDSTMGTLTYPDLVTDETKEKAESLRYPKVYFHRIKYKDRDLYFSE